MSTTNSDAVQKETMSKVRELQLSGWDLISMSSVTKVKLMTLAGTKGLSFSEKDIKAIDALYDREIGGDE